MYNTEITPEIVALSDGGYAAVRVCRIPSPDPHAVALQFQACRCSEDGTPELCAAGLPIEAPTYISGVGRGMIASGQANLDAIIAHGKKRAMELLEGELQGRAVLDQIPEGEPVPGAAWRYAHARAATREG